MRGPHTGAGQRMNATDDESEAKTKTKTYTKLKTHRKTMTQPEIKRI